MEDSESEATGFDPVWTDPHIADGAFLPLDDNKNRTVQPDYSLNMRSVFGKLPTLLPAIQNQHSRIKFLLRNIPQIRTCR
jgi:hypothetical protein